MAKVINQDRISGPNLYLDKKNRTVYYNRLLKKAYQVPGYAMKQFKAFRSRYIAALAAFLILMILFCDWLKMSVWIPIVLSLIVFGVIEFFYYRFLNKLPPYLNFDVQKLRSTYDFELTPQQKKTAYIRIVLYFVLGVLIVVNGYMSEYTQTLLAACYAAMGFCFFYGFYSIWQLVKSDQYAKQNKSLPSASVKTKRKKA